MAKEVEQELLPYQDVFALHPDKIDLCPGIVGYNEISAKIDLVLRSLRDKNLFQALRGFCYGVNILGDWNLCSLVTGNIPLGALSVHKWPWNLIGSQRPDTLMSFYQE